MAWTPEEEQRRRRRRRLVRGLVLGGAALGLPALANLLVARRARRLPGPSWVRPELYDARHGTLCVRRLGTGPPLLLLHSFGPGHSSLQWRDAAEILALSYEVIVPDLLGWGDSDRSARAYDGELYIQMLSELLSDVVGRRAVVIAAGLPAAYAVQVAVDEPELVRALVLSVPLGIDLYGDEPDLKDAVVLRLLRLPILGTSALNLFTSRAGLAHHLREAYADPARVDEKLLASHYRAAHLPGAHGALAAYLSGYLNHSVSDLLPRLEQPVLLGWGRETRSPALASADLWLHELPDARLEVFAHTALLPHAEDPAAFCGALGSFLEALRS